MEVCRYRCGHEIISSDWGVLASPPLGPLVAYSVRRTAWIDDVSGARLDRFVLILVNKPHAAEFTRYPSTMKSEFRP